MTKRVSLPSVFNVTRQIVPKLRNLPGFRTVTVGMHNPAYSVRMTHYPQYDNGYGYVVDAFTDCSIHVNPRFAKVRVNEIPDRVVIGIGETDVDASGASVFLSPDQARELYNALRPIVGAMELDESEPTDSDVNESWNNSCPF